MATGGGFSRTLEGGHETFYDFSCSLCENENKHVETIKYCEDCFVFLCDHCLKVHNKFPLNQRHKLLNQSQFTTVNRSAPVSFPTRRCPKHPGELINIFCGNHDIVCCSVCKSLEHSSCVKTQHLSNAAKGIQSSQEFQKIIISTRTFVFDVDKVLTERKADLSRKDKTYLETTKTKAEDILKKLESFRGDNECDLFVQVKTALQFLNGAADKTRVISEINPSIQFKINRNIEEYITFLKSFGSFTSTGRIATLSAAPKFPISNVPVLPEQQQLDQNIQHSTYKTQKFEMFDINEMSDTNTCGIYSICQLPDDTFLITDVSNRKLKRLDQSLKLLDSVKLSGFPHSVCAAGPSQAAVSLISDKKIQLVSVGKKLTLSRSFTVANVCGGIAYIGNELYVCCGEYDDLSLRCIEVYNNEGQLQRTIPSDKQCLSSKPINITVSDDGQHLLVTSWDSDDITMLDLTGNVVSIFSHKDLKWPTGICSDGRGQVFVCGCDSNTVVQLSSKHQKIEVVLREKDGIILPKGVCYDKGKSKLIVSCHRKNELFSFTLK